MVGVVNDGITNTTCRTNEAQYYKKDKLYMVEF